MKGNDYDNLLEETKKLLEFENSSIPKEKLKQIIQTMEILKGEVNKSEEEWYKFFKKQIEDLYNKRP